MTLDTAFAFCYFIFILVLLIQSTYCCRSDHFHFKDFLKIFLLKFNLINFALENVIQFLQTVHLNIQHGEFFWNSSTSPVQSIFFHVILVWTEFNGHGIDLITQVYENKRPDQSTSYQAF